MERCIGGEIGKPGRVDNCAIPVRLGLSSGNTAGFDAAVFDHALPAHAPDNATLRIVPIAAPGPATRNACPVVVCLTGRHQAGAPGATQPGLARGCPAPLRSPRESRACGVGGKSAHRPSERPGARAPQHHGCQRAPDTGRIRRLSGHARTPWRHLAERTGRTLFAAHTRTTEPDEPSGRPPLSLPLPRRNLPERVGEPVVPLPASRGPLGQVDAPPEVCEPSRACGQICRGRKRSEREAGVHADRRTVLEEDHPPERSQVAELIPAEENRRGGGRERRADPPGLHRPAWSSVPPERRLATIGPTRDNSGPQWKAAAGSRAEIPTGGNPALTTLKLIYCKYLHISLVLWSRLAHARQGREVTQDSGVGDRSNLRACSRRWVSVSLARRTQRWRPTKGFCGR